jgi:type III pantothenate kinase
MSGRLFASIGNTTLHWALEGRDGWAASGRIGWAEGQDLAADLRSVWQAHARHMQPQSVIACVSSPERLARVEAALGLPLRVMGRDFTGGIAVAYREPGQIGADRLASATGAARLYGTPAVVVSAGTCLTCEVVSERGVLVGGVIAPGLPVYLRGLAATAPHLPLPDRAMLREAGRGPGQTTQENLARGLCISLAAAADAIASDMLEGIGASGAALLLTGGDAPIIEHRSQMKWTVAPLLTLEGLRTIHDGG